MSFAVPRLMMTLNVQFENVPLLITLKYLFIVPDAVARSAVIPVAPVNVIKSDQDASLVECCTLTIQVPDETANTCKYADAPLLVLALLSMLVIFVADECVTLPAVPDIPHSKGVPALPCIDAANVNPPSAVLLPS